MLSGLCRQTDAAAGYCPAERSDPGQIAYVGNDVNDLACLRWVGCPIAVADAVSAVRTEAQLITTRAGGQGAVREIADWLLSVKGSQV